MDIKEIISHINIPSLFLIVSFATVSDAKKMNFKNGKFVALWNGKI